MKLLILSVVVLYCNLGFSQVLDTTGNDPFIESTNAILWDKPTDIRPYALVDGRLVELKKETPSNELKMTKTITFELTEKQYTALLEFVILNNIKIKLE